MNLTSAVVLVRVDAFDEPSVPLALSLVFVGSVAATLALAKVTDRVA
jgi:hypothetical protein